MKERILGAILDIDGTLIDSNNAHALAWRDALLEAGRDLDINVIRPLVGMGADKILPALLGQDERSEEGKRIAIRRGEIFRAKYLPGIKPFPAAGQLVAKMRNHGLGLAIGTSARRADLHALLEILGIADLVDAEITRDDASHSKPDPDVICAALNRLGVPAQQVLMLGDTPYDIEGAARAGVRTVAVRCGEWSDDSLSAAIAIYDDPQDLLHRFDCSPFVSAQ